MRDDIHRRVQSPKCTFGIRAVTNKRNVAEVRLDKFCPLRQEGVTVRFETFNR